MLVRILALLLAVMMMTGAAAQVWACPDVTSEIDDEPDRDTPDLPVPVPAPLPGVREPACIEAPRSIERGRLHAVFVFRPPRLVASR